LMEGIGTAKVTDNAYKYNGKELNEDLGLNLSDYGARWYDAALGRWWSVDPMGTKAANFSSYSYVYNNPMKFVDPTGMYSEAYSFAFQSSSDLQRKSEGQAAKMDENKNKGALKDADSPNYEVSSEFQTEYPKTTSFLRDLSSFVAGEAGSPFSFTSLFMEAFKEISGLNDAQVSEMLGFSSGPTLFISNLDWDENNDGIDEEFNGRTFMTIDKEGIVHNETGFTDNAQKKLYSGLIAIDDNIITPFEMALGGGLTKEGTIQSTNAFISTLFHESVHYGRNVSGLGNSAQGAEYGKVFEKDRRTFGSDVKRYQLPKSATGN